MYMYMYVHMYMHMYMYMYIHPDSPIKKMDFFLRQGTFYAPFS